MTVSKKCLEVAHPGAGIMVSSCLALAALILVLSSCALPGMPSGDTGTLTLRIGDLGSRTLVPPVSMVPKSYSVSGSGPKGKTFAITSTSTSTSVTGLAAGVWQISVNARNASGVVIAQGSGSVTIVAGSPATLAVNVTPLAGNGSLQVSVAWPEGQLGSPSIQAQLLPSNGAAIPLDFAFSAGAATSDTTSVPAGYYTLTVQLYDNGVLVMGAVEVARIVQDQTTSGAFDFSIVNQVVGSITVAILPVMSDPLELGMTGQSESIQEGGNMTVTANVSNYNENVAYVWYLNGQAIAAGSSASPSLALGSGLSAGIYRLDVTAWTTDGLRAGTATADFTVQ